MRSSQAGMSELSPAGEPAVGHTLMSTTREEQG